jgi:hypothetical protein
MGIDFEGVSRCPVNHQQTLAAAAASPYAVILAHGGSTHCRHQIHRPVTLSVRPSSVSSSAPVQQYAVQMNDPRIQIRTAETVLAQFVPLTERGQDAE